MLERNRSNEVSVFLYPSGNGTWVKVAEVKREVISVSSRRVVLADAAKIGKPAFSVFAAHSDVDVLITDHDAIAGLSHIGSLIDRGIEVIIAD